MIELPRPYPLTWPTGRERAKHTSTSRFETRSSNGKSLSAVCDELDVELRRMGVTNFVLSTNIQTNSRGRPDNRISVQGMNPGVALYFEHGKKQICLACDKWDKVACNVMAIVKHLDALRGQQRWGVADLKRDFSGYAALPEKGAEPAWYDVLEIPAGANTEQIMMRWKSLSKIHHPDVGGDIEAWHRIDHAKDIGLASQPR